MYKKMIAILLGVTMTAGMMAGCGSPSGNTAKVEETQKTTAAETEAENKDVDWTQKEGEFSLYTYYTDVSKEQVDYALKQMKEKYPKVTFNVEHRSDSDGQILKTRAAVGELPDIIESTGTLTETLIKSGDILPLDDVMEETGFVEKFNPGTLDGFKCSDGHYYAIQASVSTAGIFYNKRVFEENGLVAPKNYEEFKKVVSKLSGNGIIPLALFAQQKWPGLQMYDLAVIAEGEPTGIMGLEDGTTKITDPAYEKAADKITELVGLDLIGKGAFNTSADQAFELLSTGKAGMVFNGSWYFSYTFDYKDDIGFFEYNPFADAGKEEDVRYNASGGTNTPGGYAVNANGTDPEFAKRLALDLAYYAARIRAEKYGDINTLSESITPEIDVTEDFLRYCEDIKSIKTKTKFEWSLNDPEMMTVLEDNTEKIYTGTYSVKDFINDTKTAIDDILK